VKAKVDKLPTDMPFEEDIFMIFARIWAANCSLALVLMLQPIAWGLPGLSEPIDNDCQKDIVSLSEKNKCSSECHDESPIDCLQTNIKEVSEGCRKKITNNRQEWEEKTKSFAAIQKACSEDFKKHKIKGTCHKDTIFNLMVNKEDITKACKEQTNKHITAHIKHLRTLD